MNLGELATRFVIVFVVGFVTNVIVVYIWNFVRHGEGTFDLGTSLTIAIFRGSHLDVR